MHQYSVEVGGLQVVNVKQVLQSRAAITSGNSSSFNDLFDVSVFVDSQFIMWEKLPN